jgi:endonuclease/exonuclease/phosphatase family metal-dependent hydrolase
MPLPSLRLLSWNIQCGIETQRTSEYFTRGWRHVLPHKASPSNLRRMAGLITHFDVVALQEVDGGSLRSGFLNQVEYLADLAGFPYCHAQRTRNLAQLGQHGNGLLSRYPITQVTEHRLPGLIPGRGAIEAHIGQNEEPLVIVVLHLSLGARGRAQQLRFIAERVAHHSHVVVMGDMNGEGLEVCEQLRLGGLPVQSSSSSALTFPSWNPSRGIDHILVTPSVNVQELEVLPYCYSDHLPIAMQIEVKPDWRLGEPGHRVPLAPPASARKIART